MATMSGELLVQMFRCCLDGGAGNSGNTNASTRRPRIDRTMIGAPTDFRHTAHVGSTDVYGGRCVNNHSDQFGLLQDQMKSKGGYNTSSHNSVPYVPHIINARSLDEIRRK